MNSKTTLVCFFIIAFVATEVISKALESDSSEINMKIQQLNEHLLVEPKPKEEEKSKDEKPKKLSRSYPIYYVNTKVNGKFGKNVRAFSSDEFMELFPLKL
ncbi:CLUMA_CG000971, isoform A [Clunio marinus]|uniref:CLUMA_CG000971, isoform A n=1 Tax=Clunio marinus TaxID=568069 RepID=A0A1J1HH06_9DIPT|nr:CLUMA_CG000971, isoform A [Clunio marinus]